MDAMIRKGSGIPDICERIDFYSKQFLGVAYQDSTLRGGTDVPEDLVVTLAGVDCFTYIDYVEAMRLSRSFSEFIKNLKRVRYRSGIVSYEGRNHFFTDWREYNPFFVQDLTGEIGEGKTVKVNKILNMGDGGGSILPGIEARERKIAYIPSDAIDDKILKGLRTGDYIGIYSSTKGLDVSHTGIFIRSGSETYLRHASSKREHRRVVDEEFVHYLLEKPGILVLRPGEDYPRSDRFHS
jgi:hypothetical protein